jgi:hypothetical protein
MKNAITRYGCLSAVLLGAVAAQATASPAKYPLTSAAYRAECGSCHVPYPPQLLPARSWQAIMAGLDKHFGSDASLDAKTAGEIRVYLASNASRMGAAAPLSTPRITQTRWFMKEHDEVPASLWKSEAVKGAFNCSACHTQAEQGDYGEGSLRLPR